jgi:VWFA-related protein
MVRLLTRALVGIAAAGAVVTGALAQQATFHSATDVITVDVSVRRGNVPVAGLASADFRVTDNGVPQTVEAVSLAAMPVNVTVLLDTSGSVAGAIESLKSQIREAAALLGDADRLRLLVFAADGQQVFPMQSPRADLRLDTVRAGGGGTSLYDAVATALIRTRAPDRGELVVAFTDGIDTASAMDVKRLTEVARRSEAVLHASIIRMPELTSLCMGPDRGSGGRGGGRGGEEAMPWLCNPAGLAAIAETTGGRLYTRSPGRHVPEGLRQALDDFHTSYTLRYALTGVARPGWHDIVVTVNRPEKLVVRARRGYFGG